MNDGIKKIIVVSKNVFCVFQVGVDGVTKIKDLTREYESGIEFVYWVYNGDKVINEIINCSVIINYTEGGRP